MASSYIDKIFLDNSSRLLLSGIPVVIVSRKFLVELQKNVEELFGIIGTKITFRKAGYKIGYKFIITHLKKYKNTEKDLIKALFKLSMKRGWGFFEIISLDLDEMKACFRISRSYGEEYDNVGRDVCYIWQGIFTGILQAIADNSRKKIRIKCVERKCVGKGDPYCEFSLFPS